VVEAYYRFQMAEWLSLTADVQWVVSGPGTSNGGTHRNVVVPGLRAVLSF
jgi:carbohydrate-selective porin OprB